MSEETGWPQMKERWMESLTRQYFAGYNAALSQMRMEVELSSLSDDDRRTMFERIDFLSSIQEKVIGKCYFR